MLRGFNFIFQHKDPMIPHFPVQSFGKPARLVFPLSVGTKKMTHSGIPCGDVTLNWEAIRPVDDTATTEHGTQNPLTEIFDRTSAAALGTTKFGNEPGKRRPISNKEETNYETILNRPFVAV